MDGAWDFLDLDSDNDCLPDWDVREAGAARTNPMAPNMSADANCGAGQMCDRTRGVCVPRSTTDAGITDAGPQDSGVVMVDAGPQDSGVVMMDAGSPPTDAGVDPLLNLTGGGCSVESRNPSGLAGAFAALAALAALRIRRRRR
jgi:MYXO-CTERM domain-containing protein